MTGNNTLEKIQREIKESLERDKELRKLYNNNDKLENYNNEANNNEIICNGKMNGTSTIEVKTKVNGVRLFTQNTAPRGLMKTFFKTRGRASSSINLTQVNRNWIPEIDLAPAKVTIEKGKPARKGFVSAEEKMKQELMDFQKREEELRNERRKSQPNIMAALHLENEEEGRMPRMSTNAFQLKSAKSMSNLYSDMDEPFLDNHSAPSSLKPSVSTAVLCDMSDYVDEIPGTHTLIRQFESLKSQDRT